MPRVTFGPFSFDRERRALTRDGEVVSLNGRGTALLAALVSAKGDVVARSALLDSGWPGLVVEEANLTVQIATLRKALGTRSDGRDWIETVQRSGYRLLRDEEIAPADMPSIAVLPFADFSANSGQLYFADGIVEDLITALSRFKTFAVVARQSSFVYKDRPVDIREVAEALGVRYVLEGSVRRVDRTVRVATQLIDARNGMHLWAEKYDGAVDDVLDFQDRITEQVIGSIEPRIRKAEIERSRRSRPESFDSYDLYLRALSLIQGFDERGHGEALELLERAMALDPGYAPVVALSSWAHGKRVGTGAEAPDDSVKCVALAERAVTLGHDDAVVLAIAGRFIMDLGGHPDRGYELMVRALELNPNSALVVSFAGHAYRMNGQYDDAIACSMRALELMPGAPEAFWNLLGIANCHLGTGRFEEAVTWCRRALEANSKVIWTYAMLAAAYAHLGRREDAGAALQSLLGLRPGMTVAGLFPGTPRQGTGDWKLVEGLLAAGLPAA